MATGKLGEPVSFPQNEERIEFLQLDPGVKPMCPGDRARFTIAPKLQNVEMLGIELPIEGAVNLEFLGGARSQNVCP